MIQLTRLNDRPLAVNSDLIKLVENAHDTVLTLINGEKIVVRESVAQVIEKIIDFRRAVLAGLPLTGASLDPAMSQAQVNEKAESRYDHGSEDGTRG